ncbi:hypothetical protein HAX54_041597 [Datura stramonium]|uniref:Pentatricopeptide repeat-containing protein n=1 Tax=Datura stramonium TaxID=4076 RepID=A0ABS8VZF8_DATST|nr:hypothetical protein [Datura stramonium]
MYCKYGLIDSASNIFDDLLTRDLISWNTMIFGLIINGEPTKSLSIYYELLEVGGQPDRITLTALLLACNYGGFVDEGIAIFSSMEEEYGVTPDIEHYTCVVGMLTRAGKLKEAGDLLQNMPHEPNSEMWESILVLCDIYGDLKEIERVAEKIMDLAPESSLPYLVLPQVYESRGRWESLVRVRKEMKERIEKKVASYSWISVRSCIIMFQANQILRCGTRVVVHVKPQTFLENNDCPLADITHRTSLCLGRLRDAEFDWKIKRTLCWKRKTADNIEGDRGETRRPSKHYDGNDSDATSEDCEPSHDFDYPVEEDDMI